jgi:2-polyprenyl-6-methoxyphenol hydroxylase-like FAD-dependent oxidoreductase
MNTRSDGKALVIGGGIGGLATAIALRRVGIDAITFERVGDLRRVQVGGLYTLWFTGVRALQQLDLADRLEKIGTPVQRVEMRTWLGNVITTVPVEELSRDLGTPAVAIMRADAHRLLAEEASTVSDVRAGAECSGFFQDTTGVTATFADGSEEHGDFLVAADGIDSVIRRQALGGSAMRYPGYGHWYGFIDVERPVLPVGTLRFLHGSGARFAFFHLNEQRLCWWCMFNAPQSTSGAADTAAADEKPKLLQRFGGWHHDVQRTLEATSPERIRRRDTLDRAPVKRWGEGRITLLGDAAHPMTFNLGQGASSALNDAVVLASCLRDKSDIETALRSYEEQRLPRTNDLIKKSLFVGSLSKWEKRPLVLLHYVLLRLSKGSLVSSLIGEARDMAFEL